MTFLLKRLAEAVLVVLVVSFVAFVLFQYVGDPVQQMLGQTATDEERAELRAALGLDRPFLVQYGAFLGNLVAGDFGLSLQQGRPVADLIVERLPATLELSAVAALLAVLIGIPAGVFCALARDTLAARALMAFSLIGVSIPTFFIGIMLILLFSVHWQLLPSFGRGETVAIGWWSTGLLTLDGWRHLVLPAITLALFQLTLIVRLVRGEMLEVMRADFVRFLKARGVPRRRVVFRHALRNAALPVVTIIGLQLGAIVAFALITETVFQWPGLGLLFAEAVAFADVPVMAAYLCLISLVFVSINLVVDAIHVIIDPRLRTR